MEMDVRRAEKTAGGMKASDGSISPPMKALVDDITCLVQFSPAEYGKAHKVGKDEVQGSKE